jgi:hypothetical protein
MNEALKGPDGKGRRARLIAMVAGVITVIAIVSAFASGYLGLGWLWLRPAAELLLLAELVGLIVLERHQLFEPVHEQVSGMSTHIADIRDTLASANLPDMRAALGLLSDRIGAIGQVTLCGTAPEVVRAITRAGREAVARDHEAPQLLRIGALSGRIFAERRWELAGQLHEMMDTMKRFLLAPDSPPDSPARRWSVRMIIAMATVESLDLWWKGPGKEIFAGNPLNNEIKIISKLHAEAVLSPPLITDNEVVLTLDDANEVWNWGLLFQGRQYASFFARWFDDMWASIPDTQMICSHGKLNQTALDRIRKELEALEATRSERRTA